MLFGFASVITVYCIAWPGVRLMTERQDMLHVTECGEIGGPHSA